MLLGNYYRVDSIRKEDGESIFDISLVPECPVYDGHFPGDPVSPGVCNIQMIKECAESIVGMHLMLEELVQCRLTSVVSPMTCPRISVYISLSEGSDAGFILKASLRNGNVSCMTLKAVAVQDPYICSE